MRGFQTLALIGCLLFAGMARAAPSTIHYPDVKERTHVVNYASTDAAGTYAVGKTWPVARIGFELGSNFVGTLYACEGSVVSDDLCDAVAVLERDIPEFTFATTRLFYVVVIGTIEGSGTFSRLVIRGSTNSEVEVSGAEPVIFPPTMLDNSFSRALATCPTMSVTFFESGTSDISLWATDPDDDTLAEIESATLVATFTASTASPIVFYPGKQQIRFVLNADQTGGTSVAKVHCITQQAKAEERIWWGVITGISGNTGASFLPGECWPMTRNGALSGGPLSAISDCWLTNYHVRYSRDLTITKVVFTGDSSNTIASGFGGKTISADGGCDFQFGTDFDTAAHTLLGDPWSHPEAGGGLGVVLEGDVDFHVFANGGITFLAGTEIGVMAKDGTFCEDEASCVCVGTGFLGSGIEFFGYWGI